MPLARLHALGTLARRPPGRDLRQPLPARHADAALRRVRPGRNAAVALHLLDVPGGGSWCRWSSSRPAASGRPSPNRSKRILGSGWLAKIATVILLVIALRTIGAVVTARGRARLGVRAGPLAGLGVLAALAVPAAGRPVDPLAGAAPPIGDRVQRRQSRSSRTAASSASRRARSCAACRSDAADPVVRGAARRSRLALGRGARRRRPAPAGSWPVV